MMNKIEQIQLQQLHTFRLKAIGSCCYILKNREQIAELAGLDDYLVLGAGSNTVFCGDFSGTLVKVELSGVEYTEQDDAWIIKAAAGTHWHSLVEATLAKGIYGFENLALIPGTVGAAPVQNIGAYGREVADFIESVEVWDRYTKVVTHLTKSDCLFAYRESIFKQEPNHWVILSVTFKLPKQWQAMVDYGELRELGCEASAQQIFQKVVAVRQLKLPDPAQQPNAGSFFKNPEVDLQQMEWLRDKFPGIPCYPIAADRYKVAAGWMIDHLGWKGRGIGGVSVHERQALVLVNTNQATGTDLIELARTIKSAVVTTFKVELEAEVRIYANGALVSI